ncbi:hypothetical protein EVAR_89024_1 [Eumeta japonica]|uniref:Uncharacterized protein n=1 Tax=Eumeta variegata TaxID=151549 RepID=A0A4C1X9W9_EUMVA|nr:hypothetical protein EVAR_89024_1 [Eumeta japonica]
MYAITSAPDRAVVNIRAGSAISRAGNRGRVYFHAAKFSTISTSGYLEVTYEYNNKRTSRDKCAKTAARLARAGHARVGGCRPARTPARISGRPVKRRSDNRRSTVLEITIIR